MTVLSQKFFMQDTVKVAEQLLGCYLVRQIGSRKLVGRIVETEAYLGLKDPCCHSFGGLYTERTKTMYLKGGYSYVYFTYGMYHCFNIVTGSAKEPEAVLIRALEPLQGIKEMQKNRKKEKQNDLCSGPGKLCQALQINRELNGKNLTQEGEVYVCRGEAIKNREADSRVGLALHEDSAYWFLRFYAKNNPHVSVKKNQIS
ncbi:MAG: DNA-3-methyladenine glycosylase [Oligoflexia bacterium]|nr:DNA-3-methyladenine glycosylase [Oligoflexia bacterium]